MNNSSSPSNIHANSASLTQPVTLFSGTSGGISSHTILIKVPWKQGRADPPAGLNCCFH